MRLILRLFLLSVFFVAALAEFSLAQEERSVKTWGDWQTWGDQLDGTYHNPVLPGDYSDLDCIKVGTDYYAISSTFQYAPGMVILHSKDLVNWTIKGHAVDDLTKISGALNWTEMDRYGKGIWAGAIRYHQNKFWIYFGTPDEGYFMTSSVKIEGPWTPVRQVLADKGWDDCCPFWDDDGQGYLIGSNFAGGYKIHLFKLNPDGTEIIKSSDQVIYQSKGSEANKLYKINGFYYHFFSEVHAEGRVVMMARAKNIYGPYTKPKQLSYAQKDAHEPNQGGLIQVSANSWWFLTHHGSGGDWSGRIMSLLPVNWVNDWPIIGKVDSNQIGRMVWSSAMPIKPGIKKIPQSSDEFANARLAPQWEWNYQSRAEKWSLTEKRGVLRLYAFKPLKDNDLLTAGNTITQRSMRTPFNEVITKIDISNIKDGGIAGLSHFGVPNYAYIGIVCNKDAKNMIYHEKGARVTGPLIDQRYIWLKSTWGLDGISQFFYSLNGKDFQAFGHPYQLKWGAYRGDRIALFNYNNQQDKGYIDVDYFRYKYN